MSACERGAGEPVQATVARRQLAESLRGELRQLQAAAVVSGRAAISSGFAALDRLLPGGGFAPGSLVEWLGSRAGGGQATLALLAAREALAEGGEVVVVDRRHEFYPPAAAAWGLSLERLTIVHPRQAEEELWVLDQALRCSSVAAVWAPLEQIEDRSFRRLQLAAEAGGAVGLLIRSAAVRGQPSWADVQLLVESRTGGGPAPESRRFHVEVTRCRRGAPGGRVQLQVA